MRDKKTYDYLIQLIIDYFCEDDSLLRTLYSKRTIEALLRKNISDIVPVEKMYSHNMAYYDPSTKKICMCLSKDQLNSDFLDFFKFPASVHNLLHEAIHALFRHSHFSSGTIGKLISSKEPHLIAGMEESFNELIHILFSSVTFGGRISYKETAIIPNVGVAFNEGLTEYIARDISRLKI